MNLGNYSRKPQLKDCIEFIALRIAKDKSKCPHCKNRDTLHENHE
jgi:hypothetical protein